MSLKESIPIELGGKTRHLRYDFNALVALQEEMKISLENIADILKASASLRDIRTILWAGLIHEDQALTPFDAGALVDSIEDISIVGTKIREAFEAAFPSVKTTGERKKVTRRVPGKSGTSKSS